MYCASPRGGLANPREGLAEGPNIHTHFLIYITISVYIIYILFISSPFRKAATGLLGGHGFSIVDCHTWRTGLRGCGHGISAHHLPTCCFYCYGLLQEQHEVSYLMHSFKMLQGLLEDAVAMRVPWVNYLDLLGTTMGFRKGVQCFHMKDGKFLDYLKQLWPWGSRCVMCLS